MNKAKLPLKHSLAPLATALSYLLIAALPSMGLMLGSLAAASPTQAPQQTPRATPAGPTTFQKLLSESNLSFHPPLDLQESKGLAQLHCNKHFSKADNSLDLCIMLRPIARMSIDYEDPHSSAPDPNQIYPLLFESLVNTLSDHQHNVSQSYSPEQAQSLFGADWANAAAFNLQTQFKQHGKPNALLVASHKHGQADLYLLFRYGDAALAKRDIPKYLGIMRFD